MSKELKIKCKLRVLMALAGIKTIVDLEEATGIHRITLTKFADMKGTSIDFNILIKLAKFFNLTSINELMEFEEVEND